MSRSVSLLWLSLLCGDAAHAVPVSAVKTFPYKAVGSTILVPVEVAGSKPGWFILDTGANSCVFHTPFAEALGLKPVGARPGSGAGAGPVQFDTYPKDIAFSIAGVKFACPHTLGIDLGNQPEIIGQAVDGIVGTDLFAEYIVETDYELQIVRLYDRSRFSYAGSGRRIPFTFDRRRPIITARLTAGGKSADRPLLVDSGSQSAIDDEWIRESDALRGAQGGVGLGKAYRTVFGRLSAAEIGPFRFTDVPGVSDGVSLVGGEVLQRFTIIYDWPRQELILEPHPYITGSLAQSNASGLSLRQGEKGEIRIEDVGVNTPAARAGLQKADIIAAVDGSATLEFGFSRMSRLFKPFRAYRLTILRGGAYRNIDLTM